MFLLHSPTLVKNYTPQKVAYISISIFSVWVELMTAGCCLLDSVHVTLYALQELYIMYVYLPIPE